MSVELVANDHCESLCLYALDTCWPEYAGVSNGKCAAHDGYMAHLAADTADTYEPRHAWPTECGGERCATHAIAHTPRHRAGDGA